MNYDCLSPGHLSQSLSVFVDLSLPKRRALFDFPRDPQFVKSKLTYLLMRIVKRPWTDWHGWNSTINFGLGATSIRWVSRHETMVSKRGFFTKNTKMVKFKLFEVSFFQKMSLVGGEGFVNLDFARHCESVNAQ
jgi:hypothetical protein